MITSPVLIGYWLYPPFTGVALPVARFTIRITARSADPLEFGLHQLTAYVGHPDRVDIPYRVAAPPLNTPTDVPLPLGWARLLLTGGATGISLGGGDFTANVTDDSGLLTFTPLS
jgi:hypothetical protein